MKNLTLNMAEKVAYQLDIPIAPNSGPHVTYSSNLIYDNSFISQLVYDLDWTGLGVHGSCLGMGLTVVSCQVS